MTFSLRTRAIASTVTVCMVLTGCSKDDGEETPPVEKIATAPATPENSTHSVTTTGSAYLNGYEILPVGSTAVCSTHNGVTTIIIGDLPSENAASVIIDDQGVSDLSIADTEDAVEFTDHSHPTTVTRDGGNITVEGSAEGSRVIGESAEMIDMTFVLSAACG